MTSVRNCVLLLLIVRNTLGDPPPKEPVVKRFGCSYMNDQYELRRNVSPEAVWGTPIVPTNFDSVESLAKVLVQIQCIMRDLIEELNYNNVNVFKQFFYDFADTSVDFKSFFRDYRPKYRRFEHHDAQAIELMKRIANALRKDYSSIEQSMFLSASVTDATDVFVRSFNETDENPPRLKYFNHVLGTIKISIGAFGLPLIGAKKRQGVILLEPGINMPTPIVVMEDKLPPHGPFDYRSVRNVDYEVLAQNHDYIINLPPPNTTSHKYPYWIYVGKPYCSCLDTTSKYELLNSYRSIIKRDREGGSQGGLYFSIQPKDKEISPFESAHYGNVSRPYFVLFIRRAHQKEARYPIPFKRIKVPIRRKNYLFAPSFSTEEEIEVYDKVSALLGYENNDMAYLLQEMAVILENEAFLESVNNELVPSYNLTKMLTEHKPALIEFILDTLKKAPTLLKYLWDAAMPANNISNTQQEIQVINKPDGKLGLATVVRTSSNTRGPPIVHREEIRATRMPSQNRQPNAQKPRTSVEVKLN